MIPLDMIRARIVERWTLAPLADPISMTLSSDEEWSPRVTATLTVADTADLSGGRSPAGALLWKYQGDILTIRVEKLFGEPISLAALTADYGGTAAEIPGSVEVITRAHTIPWNAAELLQPLSAATALWGGSASQVTAACGGSVAEITWALRQPGGSYRVPASERVTARLRTRRITPHPAEGTVSYELCSADIVLHDYRRTATTTWTSSRTSLRGLCRDVLDMIQAGAGTTRWLTLIAHDDATIPAGTEWKTGQSAWDVLHPVLEAAGWVLYGDMGGALILAQRTPTAAPVTLDAATNLISASPDTDYGSAFYEGAVIEYSDALDDEPHTRYDVYAPSGAQRIAHETRAGVNPGTAAAALVERSRVRGQTGDASATLQPLLAAGQVLTLRLPDADSGSWGPTAQTRQGTISSLAHRYPDSTTSITLRDYTTI